MSNFVKFYINDIEHTPLNIGSITLDYTRERESGSYQYVKSLASKIKFGNEDGAYSYIMKHGVIQTLVLRLTEFCAEFPQGIDIFKGEFTRRGSLNNPISKIIEIDPTEDSLYQNVLKNYDRSFNMLESPTVVGSTYAEDISRLEFSQPSLFTGFVLTYGYDPISDGASGSLFFGLTTFAREVITTYCQGGALQAPKQGAYATWKLLFNNCEGRGLSTWYRLPDVLRPALANLLNTDVTICTGLGCIPPTPPLTVLNETWELITDPIPTTLPVGALSLWIDRNSISKNDQIIDNGRLLTEVINHGLNQHKDTEDLDLQSQLLFNIVSPVDGSSPSTLYQAQLHSITDVKDPNATEQATVEKVTLNELLTGAISGKFNAFWRVDEGTKRFIVEHISNRNNSSVIDLRLIDNGQWLKQKGEYSYNNTDIPRAEEFPSLDVSIDFTGVDIDYDNGFSKGKKSFTTDKFYSEITEIISGPDEYPQDGIVIITPDSLAPLGTLDLNNEPIGTRTKNGFITGDYRPNAPQGMANLQEEFFIYDRPFPSGVMNFNNKVFEDPREIQVLEPIDIPVCCFFLFSPTSEFIGKDFEDGQLISSSYNLASKIMTLNLEY